MSGPMTDTKTLHEWFDDSRRPRPFLIIAGPCVLETPEINRRIGGEVSEICADLEIPYVFKASFDKANRSSIGSARGPGAERGLEEIANIGRELSRPTCTDIHLPEQATMAADHVSLLQIPAFLCRQTDLLCAAAETGAAVNVKKGQFLGPDQMKNVISKIRSAGGERLMLTERGTFFGYDRLVNDFIGLGDMMVVTPSSTEINRGQGTLVTDKEVRQVATFLKSVAGPSFERSLMSVRPSSQGGGGEPDSSERDALFEDAVEVIIETGRGSVSLLQRRLAIGYSRASRLIDQMGMAGIISDHKGSVARDVLISMEEWERMKRLEAGLEASDAAEDLDGDESVPDEMDGEYRQ